MKNEDENSVCRNGPTLPGWFAVISVMADGRWYTHRALRLRLPAMKVQSLKFYTRRLVRRGWVERVEHPNHKGFPPVFGTPERDARWVYRLTEAGRMVLLDPEGVAAELAERQAAVLRPGPRKVKTQQPEGLPKALRRAVMGSWRGRAKVGR